MTSKKIARTKRTTKAKPVAEGIRRAAERSGIKPAKAKPATVRVSRENLERWGDLIERAQHNAIKAAPRTFPTRGDGQDAAIAAYDQLRWVRREIAQVVGGAEGGAS
jgi:hypothetical protein